MQEGYPRLRPRKLLATCSLPRALGLVCREGFSVIYCFTKDRALHNECSPSAMNCRALHLRK